MEVQDCIKPMFCTQLDHTIQVLESLRFEHSRLHVVLEVTIVERNTNAVETKRGKEGGIGVTEEVFEKLRAG